MEIEPNVEDSQLLDTLQQDTDYLQTSLEQQAAQEASTAANLEADAQATAEQSDPREAEDWGFKALAKEGQSILTGGLQDTASSVTTFPERTIDAFSGEMQKEREENGYYRPEWILL